MRHSRIRFLALGIGLIALPGVPQAQLVTEQKGRLAMGTGCSGDLTKLNTRLASCPINRSEFRVWCPNGKVYDREAAKINAAIVRSMCDINQAL